MQEFVRSPKLDLLAIRLKEYKSDRRNPDNGKVIYTFNPSPWEAGRWISMNLRLRRSI